MGNDNLKRLKNRIWRACVLAVVAIMGTACLPSATGSSTTSESTPSLGPSVKVESLAPLIRVNDTLQVAVKVYNIDNLVAYEAHLSFDPKVLEITKLIDGGFVKPDFVVQNTFDNTAGTIDYAVAQIGHPPAIGSGTLFEIVFNAKTLGNSSIQFREIPAAPTGAILADPNGVALPVSLINGNINVSK